MTAAASPSPRLEPVRGGLSQAEAEARLARDGPNELEPPRRRGLWHIALEAAREPMFQLLVAAGLIYVLLGDRAEAAMLLGFVAVSISITIVQERRTERVLEALRNLTSPRALVWRDGSPQRIAGRDVVVGDWLLLEDGDRVAADARLLSANDLQADESLLTGESVPVHKRAAVPGELAATAGEDGAAAVPGGDDQPWVYAGTLVTGGQGLAEVVATGARSAIGRIGHSLGTIESPPTPMQQQVRRLVRVFSVLGLGLSAAVLLLYGLLRGGWVEGLLAGITLAMSMLPEEFPLILTVFMAMGAWRISQQRVLTRRSATIEALGSATVLCTDKTGTLTVNQMALAALVDAQGERWPATGAPLPASHHALLATGLLACETTPADPMDKAFHTLVREQAPALLPPAGAQLVREYPLAAGLMAMTHGWQWPDGPRCLATKGAPEAVARLCRLDPAAAQAVAASSQQLAAQGLRVLGVARASLAPQAPWPAQPQDQHFEWLGLAALADPLRPSVPAAVQACREAGIRVLMITGDHPATASAIAAQAGLDGGAPPVTGAALAQMDEAALRAALRKATVFARVQPEQKLRLVQALKADGQVVAMTGDGVNDAPSLKAAHIGIAMGQRGTDVAREAASLVLLDDDFGAVVHAVRLGRRILDNLRKAMAFVLAVHVPIAGLTLLPLLVGAPPLFAPVHIAFLELLIDPVCSIVFEAEQEDEDLMRRPPRDPAAPLFSPRLVVGGLLQGALVMAAVGAFYLALLGGGLAGAAAGALGLPESGAVAPPVARAAAFVALVACNIALILLNRASGLHPLRALLKPNRALWWVLLATAALLALALALPPLRAVFGFMLLPPALGAAALAIGLAVWLTLYAGRHGLSRLTFGAP